MTPVYQTIVDPGIGDCLRAAYASILDLPIESVPNFAEMHGFSPKTADVACPSQEWLADLGYMECELYLQDLTEDMYDMMCAMVCMTANLGPVYALGSLPSQRFGDVSHAVVLRINGFNSTPWVEVAHDPNPDNEPYDLSETKLRSISFISLRMPANKK